MEISTVAVIGAGTMGRGIAQVAAVHGLTVRLVDTSEAVLQQAFQTIEHHLQRQLNKSLITLEQVEAARKRITCLTDIAAAVADVELVIEAVPEDPTLKGQLFAALDAQAPAHAILASNTSSISITWLGTRTRRPEQVIGMHFF